MNARCFYLFQICLLLLMPTVSGATDNNQLLIGTIERPPFATLGDDEQWSGFSIELIEEISRRIDVGIEYQTETVFAEMLDNVANNVTHMAAANISVTASREQIMDFSQPIYTSGLQILTPAETGGIPFLQIIWESGVLLFLGVALLVLLIVAHLMWFFERGEDAKHDYFRDEYWGGIWDAFWWAFIICTMGGFEKERPEHIIGRVIAVFWVLASLFFISTFNGKNHHSVDRFSIKQWYFTL